MPLIAQVYDKPGNYGLQYKRLASDIQFNLPFVDKNTLVMSPALLRPGALVCHTGDSLIYMWSGTAFNVVDGSVPWRLGGNNVTGLTNFGTTSNFAIPFITNNTEKMRLNANGFLGIGNNNPQYMIDVLTNNNAIERIFLNNSNTGVSAQSWIQAGNSTVAAVLLAHSTFPKAGVYTTGAPLWLGTNLESVSGGTQPIIFATGGTASGNERGRITSTGKFLFNTTTEPAERVHLNGTLRVSPTATASTVWGSTGGIVHTSDAEQSLQIRNSGQTNFWKIGVGTGGGVSGNFPFIYFSDGNQSFDFGFRATGCCSGTSNVWELLNANSFGIRKNNGQPTVIAGAVNGTATGNALEFQSNCAISGGNHTPTAGTYNLMILHANTGNGFFQPTSGNAQMNSIVAQPTINQVGSTGVTRGFYANPTLTAAADYRAFEANAGTHWGFFLTAAKNFTTGTIEAVGFKETIVNTSGALAPTPNRHYFFSGAAAVWTLPAVAGNTNAKIIVKNVGTGAITVNSNAGANDIFTSTATNTMTVNVGDAVEFVNNGTFWGVE